MNAEERIVIAALYQTRNGMLVRSWRLYLFRLDWALDSMGIR